MLFTQKCIENKMEMKLVLAKMPQLTATDKMTKN